MLEGKNGVLKIIKKKQIITTAIQYTGENNDELIKFTGEKLNFNSFDKTFYITEILSYYYKEEVYTSKRNIFLKVGDWIIKKEDGSFFICNSDIFNEIYQILNEQEI